LLQPARPGWVYILFITFWGKSDEIQSSSGRIAAIGSSPGFHFYLTLMAPYEGNRRVSVGIGLPFLPFLVGNQKMLTFDSVIIFSK
jgi:hypothetical protein